MNFLNWLIITETQASNFEKPFTKVVAAFAYPFQADEFIKCCLPAERKHLFKVININELEAAENEIL